VCGTWDAATRGGDNDVVWLVALWRSVRATNIGVVVTGTRYRRQGGLVIGAAQAWWVLGAGQVHVTRRGGTVHSQDIYIY